MKKEGFILIMGFKIKQVVKMFCQNIILPILYFLFSRGKIEEGLVLFADAHHDELPYSMETIYYELKQRDYKVEEHFINYKTSSFVAVLFSMFRFMLAYAKAEYVFICDNFLPVASCNKRKETNVIQLWHAGGILKKFAYDTARDIPTYYKGNVFKNYTLVTVSAPICIPVYVSAMKTNQEYVKATGLSRTDRFYDGTYLAKCREEFFEKYPDAKGKKIALWAPTFRGNAANPDLVGIEEMATLQEKLGDEWYVIIKVHPHIDTIKKVSNCDIQTERLLAITDVLISDYSSVIFDYVLLEKPLVLFVADLAYYKAHDQLYIDFNEMPGAIVEEREKLADCIINEYKNYNMEKIKIFKEKYMGACDGQATERILKRLKC